MTNDLKNTNNAKIDLEALKALGNFLTEHSLSEIEYADGDFAVRLSKSSRFANDLDQGIVFEPAHHQSTGNQKTQSLNSIKSPMVGVVYLSPSPQAPSFISVGSSIKKGDVIMIIEAMKVMNEVKSSIDGVVKKICIENGKAVEYGEVLVEFE